MTDDLQPEVPQAVAILAAVSTLRRAGIDADLTLNEGEDVPYRIALRLPIGHPAILSAIEFTLHAAQAEVAIQTARQPPTL